MKLNESKSFWKRYSWTTKLRLKLKHGSFKDQLRIIRHKLLSRGMDPLPIILKKKKTIWIVCIKNKNYFFQQRDQSKHPNKSWNYTNNQNPTHILTSTEPSFKFRFIHASNEKKKNQEEMGNLTQNYLESQFNMAIRSSRQPCDHNPWKPLTPRIRFLLYSHKIDWIIGNIEESKTPTSPCNS